MSVDHSVRAKAIRISIDELARHLRRAVDRMEKGKPTPDIRREACVEIWRILWLLENPDIPAPAKADRGHYLRLLLNENF